MDFDVDSGSSNLSDSSREVIGSNESFSRFLPYTKLHFREASNESDQLKIHQDINHGSSNSINYSLSDYGGSIDSLNIPIIHLGSRSSQSAALEDLVPMNKIEGFNSIPFTTDKNDGNDTSSRNSSKPKDVGNGSSGLTTRSPASDMARQSVIHGFSPTQSPPIQVMEQPQVFDPHRIPSNIFEKPPTPTEWSLASNDSLFSIRFGNSFTRDHASVKNDLTRSGSKTTKNAELQSSSEVIMITPPPPIVVTSIRNQSANPTVEKRKTDERTSETGKDGCKVNSLKLKDITEGGLINVTIKDDIKSITNPQLEPIKQTPEVSWIPTSTSNPSDERGNRTLSSAPVRKKSSPPSCYCFSCNRSLCCCTWPKWRFGCPSCDCNCPSCDLRCPSCDCKTSCDCNSPSCDCKCPSCNFRCPSCKFGCPSCKFGCPTCRFGCLSCKLGCCCCPPCNFCSNCSCWSWCCNWNCGCKRCFPPCNFCSNCSWSWCCNWNYGCKRCCPPFNMYVPRSLSPSLPNLSNYL
ncbi:hypothetical protein K2173_017089 [Erythroxylum novogranatense]|uniref:Uncharacterized protein n=1 Tax=Erythroxylum novogranatense TaxID=1862640 RepID=A0AAV8U5V0_9ROSI|nr:hypothetical protein K2173_017089 [Erythroxylum novogranatense]